MVCEGLWEKVGVIGVDAGLCWIGDPCYVMPNDGEERAQVEDWALFCDKVRDKEAHQFNYAAGHPGLGVCVSTGHGDGTYPVEVRRKDGRIAEVRVKFL